MWEEDPRYQNVTYRLLIGSIVTLTLIVTTVSIWRSDWALLGHWFLGLGVLTAALCHYAAIVWLIAQLVQSVAGFGRKDSQKDRIRD
jgi:hypothetical protein